MEKEKSKPSMEVRPLLLFFFHTLFTSTCIASDSISINKTIRDGETIVSAEESFELGFFSLSNTSQNRYLGIWYKKLATGWHRCLGCQ
ncbi:putative non-specific serine/threonine protein kinase [Helianthus annuus]|nr:putative non-specific serine/threonine protein kinase [Helianthus annuus]KAJ0459177.1 putative non-specific serine/threonine protein kinase [Helianthus annuus]KAJ0639733.1 putative non-specific serine/threonine protein kinase [Helianthus annuus]KAJ0643674.1 putative non-specific serine/threonine protein kinase [Helianthus annuus]KAJ0819811.1 putative non-specific serine/threonine protein kinase [Helianthus annuus]